MSDRFIEKAVATNCALIDDAHENELRAAMQMLAADPDIATSSLVCACITGNAAAVEHFLNDDAGSVNRAAGPRDWPPLLYLCFSRFLRSPEFADRLLQSAAQVLKRGADPNAFFMPGEERETCLYAACGVANHAGLTGLLLKHGAEVNDEDASYHVAEFDQHDCIRVLFKNGMDSQRRATVLLRKLDFDDIEGVRVILDLGTDPNEQGIWKKSALHQAIMRGRSQETVRLLIERGADVNQLRGDGMTPYQIAREHNRTDVVELLGDAARAAFEPQLDASTRVSILKKPAIDTEVLRMAGIRLETRVSVGKNWPRFDGFLSNRTPFDLPFVTGDVSNVTLQISFLNRY